MTQDPTVIWIKTGYEIFAQSGPDSLKTEPLAKKVGISKSSFYHHFADMDVFIDMLLSYHLEQSYTMAEKEKKAESIDPELINILVEHKHDLLFNRQLRIHQNVPQFAKTLAESDRITGNGFKIVWAKDSNLKASAQLMDGVYELALQNFFLQINADNLNYEWLSAYFKSLNRITNSFV